jgi:alkanesulfonate monooxygenase SsuD/methylene tetrahydromethanopterin reductase-like flavin-dependent oxidoreductase (luciferase family)
LVFVRAFSSLYEERKPVTMRIGHMLWQPTPDMSISHAERLANTIEMVQLLEVQGFDIVTFGENHFSNYGYSPNPILLAAAIGQHTERIDLGTSIVVTPFWHPIRLAEDVATTDQLLKGRFELGIGRGYQQLEFHGLNVPYEERTERYEEALAIMLGAWASDSFTYGGKYFQVPRAINVYPKPFTQPHPRILVSAVSPDSVKMAAATDFKVFGSSTIPISGLITSYDLYMNERRWLGRPGDYWVYGSNRHVFVVDSTDPDVITKETHEGILRTRRQFRLGEGLRRDTVGYEKGEVIEKPLADEQPLEEFAKNTIVGSPEQVTEQLLYLRDVVGVQELNVMGETGGLDHPRARRSAELLGKFVLPALHSEPVDPNRPVPASYSS